MIADLAIYILLLQKLAGQNNGYLQNNYCRYPVSRWQFGIIHWQVKGLYFKSLSDPLQSPLAIELGKQGCRMFHKTGLLSCEHHIA